LDREITFSAQVAAIDWKTGEPVPGLLGGRTRPSRLYSRLFVNLADWANVVLYALVGLAILFTVIVLAAMITGIRLTRTITASIAELYRATQHINRADFDYRIPVRSRDQLAELETAFNRMSESLKQLIAEHKEKQRMEGELAIAQEVQAQLFPSRPPDLRTLEVHGVCRPARTVSGDYFDFLSYGADKLAIAVGDISGKGISAALLMATVHSAVRAYQVTAELSARNIESVSQHSPKFGGGIIPAQAAALVEAPATALVSPATVMWYLNRQLYDSTPAEKYATL
jgi:sigma-B regulation protein RsbU (phosphoserine phosphatase)